MLKKSVLLLSVAACVSFASQVNAQTAPAVDDGADDAHDIVVVGTGQTRSVSSLTPASL